MTTQDTLARRNLDAVQSLGYLDATLVEGHSFVKFTNEGVLLFVQTPDNDPSCLAVYAVCEAHADTFDRRLGILEYVNDVALNWAGVKVVLHGEDTVIVTEEMFIPRGGDISEMVNNASKFVTAVVKEYSMKFSREPQ